MSVSPSIKKKKKKKQQKTLSIICNVRKSDCNVFM